MAFCDYCDPPVETLTHGDWKITLVDVLPCAISTNCSGTGLYDWYYEVKKISTDTSSGLNFLAMLIPDCCSGSKIIVDLGQSTLFKEYFPVAEGEPTVYFGRYNEQARVAKGTPDRDIHWHLITNTNVKTNSTIILKVKKIGVLTFEMAVPGCSGYGAYTPTAAQQEVTINSVRLRILRAPGTGAGIALEIWDAVDEEWDPVTPEEVPPLLDGVTVVDCGGTRGKSKHLQECIFTAASSPGWTYINLGGTWYKVWIP
jgi:hypothetical protein